MTETGRGHRALPHTADVILEAWAPDFPGCCEEAVTAVVDACVDRSGAVVVGHHGLPIAAASPETMLLDAVEGLIFVLDTERDVPVGAEIRAVDGGALELRLTMADRTTVEPIGSGPKAVSRSGFELLTGPDGVRCRFLIDV